MAKDLAKENKSLTTDKKADQKQGPSAKPPKKKKKKSYFFRDLKSEIKKVVWPTKQQVKNNTLVVLGFMLVVGVIIWSMDAVFAFLMKLIFQAS